MKRIQGAVAAAAIFGLVAVSPVSAQSVNGEVRKVDTTAGKITLKHDPIPSLEMDEPMTMVFHMPDAAALKQLKVGDKVKFDADRVDGKITVTKIRKTP